MIEKDFAKTFCPRIWNELFVDRAGTIKPCCAYAGNISSQGVALNIATHTEEDIQASSDWTELKRKSLRGEPIEGCKWTCYRDEAEGGKSQRLMAIKGLEWRTFSKKCTLPETRDARMSAVYEVLESEARTSVLHLQYGDSCNLRCRMCNPLSSSRIAADPVQSGFLAREIPKYHKIERKNYKDQWFTDKSSLQEKLISFTRKSRVLNISAGEPFINPNVLELLQRLCETNLAPKLKLQVTTNGTLSNQKLIKRLLNFQEVRLVVSIDGVGPVNDYIRDGSGWCDILQSLDRFSDAGFLLTLSPTVQIYNLFDLPNIAALAMARRINLSSGWVNSPTFLNPLKLPLKTRLAVCDHLEERARTLGLHGQYEGFVREVIGRLSSSGAKNGNKKIIDSFFRYTTELDHSRKQSFEHALPSLAKVVNPGSIQEAFESYDTPVSNEIKFPSNSFQTTDPAVEISTISNLEDQNGRLKRMLIEALLELDRQKR